MTEKQLKELLDDLSIKEKIGQLIQLSGDFFTTDQALLVGPQEKLGIDKEMVSYTGSVLNVLGKEKVTKIQTEYLEKAKHKIPLLFMADIIYGYKMIYPIPLGMACSYNPDLVEKIYHNIAKEAATDGANVTFAPMTDLVRDARWGRCMESTGEDTYLNARFAKAMVQGFQGDFTPGESLASCVKHFAGYGAVEAGREYNTVDLSKRRLREEHLPSYKAAIDAGCELVMTSFNTIDEIPVTANEWLLQDVLRKEWGFDGIVITDYAAIQELIAHGVAQDEKEASYLAMRAGVDIDMKSSCYANQIEPLLKDGMLDITAIDQAVLRVLRLKNKLGLFENPFAGMDDILQKTEHEDAKIKQEQDELAMDLVKESMVLLKNKNQTLPLKKEQKIALIGPYADNKDLIGLWAIHADRSKTITLKEAFKEVCTNETVSYEKGCKILNDMSVLGAFGSENPLEAAEKSIQTEEEMEKAALQLAKESDVVILALGEHALQSGEAGSRTDITLPDVQKDLLKKISKLGKPVVLILFNGRPLVLTKEEPYADAILEAWFPGTLGARAIVDLLYGKANPSGKLTMSFPYAVGQVPVYYNGFSTGRPMETSTHSQRFMSKYLDCPNEPLYCFGHGLSYTQFSYKNMTLTSEYMKKEGSIKVSVELVNTGTCVGDEIVQLYIRDEKGSVVRPVKELKGFLRVNLKPGETKTVTFEITTDMLKFHTKDLSYCAEPGKFVAMVGTNANQLQQKDFWLLDEEK